MPAADGGGATADLAQNAELGDIVKLNYTIGPRAEEHAAKQRTVLAAQVITGAGAASAGQKMFRLAVASEAAGRWARPRT